MIRPEELRHSTGRKARRALRLPDLKHAKASVLNSLSNADAQREYRYAIEEFVEWYCSESRLAFSRPVVTRYNAHLDDSACSDTDCKCLGFPGS
jgi:hypothetical protein